VIVQWEVVAILSARLAWPLYMLDRVLHDLSSAEEFLLSALRAGMELQTIGQARACRCTDTRSVARQAESTDIRKTRCCPNRRSIDLGLYN
jgi:hypothetical protein